LIVPRLRKPEPAAKIKADCQEFEHGPEKPLVSTAKPGTGRVLTAVLDKAEEPCALTARKIAMEL
jgi:hypothetical protein